MSKKILLVVSSMNTGGAERVASQLANAWVRRGDDVTLLATYSGRGGCAYELDATVNFRFLADEPGGGGRGLVPFARRLLAFRRFVKKSRPDVVVSFLTSVNVMSLLATARLEVPVIAAEHSYPPAQPMTAAIGRLRQLTYPRASMVTVLTGEGRDWIKTNIPGAAVEVIPNPVQLPLNSSEPRIDPLDTVGSQRRLLLAAGRHDEGKQFSHLVSAFAGLSAAHQDWDLVVLGDGPARKDLQHLVDDLGISERVRLPGRAGNMGDWYMRADLLALTSRFEGFPLVLVEAMAHGCPVVSYDCDTGPRDIVRHGIDGLLVPPSDGIAGLTAALGQLMADADLRSKMGLLGEAAMNRYSMEHILESWDSVFDRVWARS
jgi:GalNAc-alpha-(1->4)-GalNAc-alpha-(1->3)-diNAcBac-PP-undecaprenol alpha-1,4-N-acetyl-D-galactosaminyltransferase